MDLKNTKTRPPKDPRNQPYTHGLRSRCWWICSRFRPRYWPPATRLRDAGSSRQRLRNCISYLRQRAKSSGTRCLRCFRGRPVKRGGAVVIVVVVRFRVLLYLWFSRWVWLIVIAFVVIFVVVCLDWFCLVWLVLCVIIACIPWRARYFMHMCALLMTQYTAHAT